jgi:DNA-binding response OmpR family regulator
VPYSALVVDADPQALTELCRLLERAGYLVASASTLAEGTRQLVSVRPDLLVTTVRLSGFSGLHLVARGRMLLPDVVAVVTHAAADPTLQADAAAHGAFYFCAPIDPGLLLEIVAQSLDGRRPRRWRVARRWRRKRIVSRVDALLGARPGLVVDVSYGGAQLQLRSPVDEAAPPEAAVVFRSSELRMQGRRVWSRAAGHDGPWWYGVELDAADSAGRDAWRAFVDALS